MELEASRERTLATFEELMWDMQPTVSEYRELDTLYSIVERAKTPNRIEWAADEAAKLPVWGRFLQMVMRDCLQEL